MELLFEYPYVWGCPDNYKNLVEKDSMEYSFANENKPILLFSMHMGCVDTMLFLMSEKKLTSPLVLIITLQLGIGLKGLSLPLMFKSQATFSGADIKR